MNNSFDGEYEVIPENLRGAILRYVENKVQPGGFLTAVLNNDLYNAIGRADSDSLKVLPVVVRWFANRNPELYGQDNFKRHLEKAA